MPRHKKTGRKPLEVPRYRRQVYLSSPSIASIKEWIGSREERKKPTFSSALNEMIGIASYYAADAQMGSRLRPANDVLAGLCDIPEHVRIDSNTGRHLRCRLCREYQRIEDRRFKQIIQRIAAFVAEHRHESDNHA